MKPAVAILAAGRSERLGECKALVDLAGRSVLARLIDAARAGGAGELAVIAGADSAGIARALLELDPEGRVRFVRHETWALGRSGSVASAARAFAGRGVLLAPVDVPLVGAPVFRALLDAWEQAGDPARGWLAPRLEPGSRYGHPLVLGRDLAAEVQALDPAAPLRTLRARAAPLLSVRVDDPAILDDLDTLADLERLRAGLERPR